jgi:PQ loop repeat
MLQNASLFLGFFIILGLLISYFPQFLLLLSRKSTAGLSKLFLLLGFLGTISSLLNVICLQLSSLLACQQNSILECLSSTLAITQIFTQSSCFITIVILYLYYSFDIKLLLVMVSYVVVLVSITAGLIFSRSPKDEIIIYWAGILGMIALMTGTCQYVPQLIATFRHKVNLIA